MNIEILKELAAGRPDLLGPLALNHVPTDLLARALGLKRTSSLFKKISRNPDAYPRLYSVAGSHRKYFNLVEVEAWSAGVLQPVALSEVLCDGKAEEKPATRLGRPTKSEVREAERMGITVPELRQCKRAKERVRNFV